MAFTKILDTKKYGQVVMMKRQDSQGAPEIRFYFEGKGFGVCEFGIGFMNEDNAEARLDEAFRLITPQEVVKLVTGWFDHATRKEK